VVQVVGRLPGGAQETLVDLGVEDGDALPFVGQHVGVAARRRRALDYRSAAANPKGCDQQQHLPQIENIGISPDRIDAAICNGLARAAETTRGLDWFEVQSVGGPLENRAIARLPITIKVGSSTVEAGCKAILAQRLKRSGMCWNMPAPRHPHPAHLSGARIAKAATSPGYL
jgi:dodecin